MCWCLLKLLWTVNYISMHMIRCCFYLNFSVAKVILFGIILRMLSLRKGKMLLVFVFPLWLDGASWQWSPLCYALWDDNVYLVVTWIPSFLFFFLKVHCRMWKNLEYPCPFTFVPLTFLSPKIFLLTVHITHFYISFNIFVFLSFDTRISFILLSN